MTTTNTPDNPEGTPVRGRQRIASSSDALTAAFGPTEWALLAGTAVIWGSSFLLIDIGLESLRPGVISMVRVALGAAALALIPAARRPIDRGDRRMVALYGAVGIGIPFLLFPVAQQWVDSSAAGMINGAVPVMSTAWSAILVGALPAGRQRLGIAIGFAGVVAISLPGFTTAGTTALGVALVVAAVVMYGLGTNLAAPLQQRNGTLPVLLRAQLASLVVITPFGVAQIPGSEWELGPMLAMIPLGVLGTGLAFILMITLLGRVGAPRGSISIYFTPVVAIVLGVLLRGETVEPVAIAGTALVVAGAWLASRNGK